METFSLNGTWQFRRKGEGEWMEGEVPGEVYSDLLRKGEIKDPYYGKNEIDLQWVGKSDWEYRRAFEITKEFLRHKRLLIECEGLDTVADIYLNGGKVGESRNMFRKYEFEVNDFLREGKNEIRIVFTSPVKYGTEKAKEYEERVPSFEYKFGQLNRNFVRKAQCHCGWDFVPCFPTMGIWRGIGLVGHSHPRIKYTVTEQKHAEGEVKLRAKVYIDSPSKGRYALKISVGGAESSKEVELDEGQNVEEIAVDIKDPKLWWPTGYGEQNLYDTDISISGGEGTHSIRKKVGFRNLELVREKDEEGESFYFRVNGVPVFAKGANWVPADSFSSRLTRDRYEDLLTSAKEANMNMVRVWGGGIYELDDFYEICDKEGILVWQEFMFACSLYPVNREFLSNVREEVKHQVRRLADHPSIALWCGNNENEWLIERGTFVDKRPKERMWDDYGDYRKLNDMIWEVVGEENPGRTFWPSSPSSDRKLEPNGQAVGDVHYWEVWYGGKPFCDYRTVKPRFVSEFGFHSFPSTKTLKTTTPEEDLNPMSPVAEHHEKCKNGNTIITKQMTEHFRLPFSFDDFVYLSQLQQGLAIKIAVEHWRRLKPYCMGTLYWQLNDIAPVISWSSLEYEGYWKALHYMARRFFAPILVSTSEEDGKLAVWLTSDLKREISGKVSVRAVTFDGKVIFSEDLKAEVPPLGSRKIGSIEIEKILSSGGSPEDTMVEVSFDGGEGEGCRNFHFFKPFKSLKLPETKLGSRVDGRMVELNAPKAALFVRLDSGNILGEFSDNYFHMTPSESRKVEFHPDMDISGEELAKELTVRHLRDTWVSQKQVA